MNEIQARTILAQTLASLFQHRTDQVRILQLAGFEVTRFAFDGRSDNVWIGILNELHNSRSIANLLQAVRRQEEYINNPDLSQKELLWLVCQLRDLDTHWQHAYVSACPSLWRSRFTVTTVEEAITYLWEIEQQSDGSIPLLDFASQLAAQTTNQRFASTLHEWVKVMGQSIWQIDDYQGRRNASKNLHSKTVVNTQDDTYIVDEVNIQGDFIGRDQVAKTTNHTDNKPSNKPKVKVLFLAANPVDTPPLKLDEEVRAIDQALRKTSYRDHFDFIQHRAVQYGDLQELLLRHEPALVHFSGHGSEAGELLLQEKNGVAHPIREQTLSRLFAVLKDNIRCVVLSACYSEGQAAAIAQHIDVVIGMKHALGDDAARNFAAAFYQGLGYGRSVKTAFDLGCVQIDLANIVEADEPQLIAPQIDPSTLYFVHLRSETT